MNETLQHSIKKYQAGIKEYQNLGLKMSKDLETFLTDSRKQMEDGKITPAKHINALRNKMGDVLRRLSAQLAAQESVIEGQSSVMKYNESYTALDAIEFFKQTKEMPITHAGVSMMNSSHFNLAFEAYSDEIEKTVAKIQSSR